MARPKSDDPKIAPPSFRLRTSTVTTIAGHAERLGKAPGAFLAEHLESRFGVGERPDGCPHPKANEVKVTTANGKAVMLVRCGLCGERVR